MTNFIPIFPLNIVVFPGEKLNLHIFEPRYKQLITECYDEKKMFGIPSVLNNEIAEWGCLVEILSIEKEHENGNLDIKTQGVKIFRLLEVIKSLPEKLYSGGIVSYPDNVENGVYKKMQTLLAQVRRFHELLEVSKDYKKTDDELTTYDIAHHIGMSITEEYEFLLLLKEDQRQEYLERHLKKNLPIVQELIQLKERIKLNGHFKKLSAN